MLASNFFTPYIPLLLTPIPFSATLEIMSIFVLGLVVIIPTVMGGWNSFTITRILEAAGTEFCFEDKDICSHYTRKFITSSAFPAFFPQSLNFLDFPILRLPNSGPSAACVRALNNNYDCELLCREIQQEELHPEKASSGRCYRFLSMQHTYTFPLTDLFSFSPLKLTGSYKAEGRHTGKTEGGAGGPDSLYLSQGHCKESHRKGRKSGERRRRKQLQSS